MSCISMRLTITWQAIEMTVSIARLQLTSRWTAQLAFSVAQSKEPPMFWIRKYYKNTIDKYGMNEPWIEAQ